MQVSLVTPLPPISKRSPAGWCRVGGQLENDFSVCPATTQGVEALVLGHGLGLGLGSGFRVRVRVRV